MGDIYGEVGGQLWWEIIVRWGLLLYGTKQLECARGLSICASETQHMSRCHKYTLS